MDRGLLQLISVAFFCLPWQSLAAGTTTGAGSPTTTGSSSFPTITDTEGTGSLAGGVGSSGGGASAGASGGSGGAFQLGTGAIVGIAVACALVVLAIGKINAYTNIRLPILTSLSCCMVLVVRCKETPMDNPRNNQ